MTSNLKPAVFQQLYRDIMTDTGARTDKQVQDQQHVTEHADALKRWAFSHDITSGFMSELIDGSRCGESPRVDGVTPDHFVRGKSDHLCTLVTVVYSVALSHHCVPTVFNTGVMVPILKKASLDSTLGKNYRPVTNW